MSVRQPADRCLPAAKSFRSVKSEKEKSIHIPTIGRYGLLAGALLGVVLFLFPAVVVAQNNDENPEVARQLAAARDEAAQLAKDADDMESLTRSDTSWQSHAAMRSEERRG